MKFSEIGYSLDILNTIKVPILGENRQDLSFKREYDFEWHLDRTPTINTAYGATKNIIDNVKDIVNIFNSKDNKNFSDALRSAIYSGKKVAAYAVFEANLQQFAELVSGRAESVQLPDDEITVEKYKVGNVEVPVAVNKSMGNITVTYIEDQYNNVYNFHKIWQECLRPGSDLCFMDIPSFSITGRYVATGSKLSDEQMYEKTVKTKYYSQTIYPLIFPSLISRGTSNATSKGLTRIKVTYVRSPVIAKNPSVTRITYNTGETAAAKWVRTIGWKSPNK